MEIRNSDSELNKSIPKSKNIILESYDIGISTPINIPNKG